MACSKTGTRNRDDRRYEAHTLRPGMARATRRLRGRDAQSLPQLHRDGAPILALPMMPSRATSMTSAEDTIATTRRSRCAPQHTRDRRTGRGQHQYPDSRSARPTRGTRAPSSSARSGSKLQSSYASRRSRASAAWPTPSSRVGGERKKVGQRGCAVHFRMFKIAP